VIWPLELEHLEEGENADDIERLQRIDEATTACGPEQRAGEALGFGMGSEEVPFHVRGLYPASFCRSKAQFARRRLRALGVIIFARPWQHRCAFRG